MGARHGHDLSTWMFERSACKPDAEGAFSVLAKRQEVDGCATQMVERVCVCVCVCVRALVLSVVSYDRGGGRRGG